MVVHMLLGKSMSHTVVEIRLAQDGNHGVITPIDGEDLKSLGTPETVRVFPSSPASTGPTQPNMDQAVNLR